MNWKTLKSAAVIGVALGLIGGATLAYFSDSETSSGNIITAGTIDIAVDGENPWRSTFFQELDDMKPSQVRWIEFEIENVGENPAVVWKHLGNFVTDTGTQSEPECDAEGGSWNGDTCDSPNERNNIHKVITYDMEISYDDGETWKIVIDGDWGVTMADVRSLWIPLGRLESDETMLVKQSYHLQADAGNEYQGDTLTFDIDLYAEQLLGSGPGPTNHGLVLENKDADWEPIIDGTWGLLTYTASSSTFDYDLKGFGLTPGISYSLIYYADPYPGNHPGALIGTHMTDGAGVINVSGQSTDLGMDLPDSADANYPAGAKLWLVPSSDYSTGHLTGWSPDDYLFESNLITYDDTDVL